MPSLSAHEIRDVNTRYHDVAAESYDAKWGIDFGETGQSQVLGKVHKLLAAELDAGFASALEIGAGT
ncbi:MAG TPA: class I SAM-dependent methyltransferase, partial [Solirubrobacteraceae bacterium]|nr:class I SAM-dependent methyltransferase [Solirubrobacteraceae bacterium]